MYCLWQDGQALVWTTAAWMLMHELQMGLSRACIDFLYAGGYLVGIGMHTWLMHGCPKLCMGLLKSVCFEKVLVLTISLPSKGNQIF